MKFQLDLSNFESNSRYNEWLDDQHIEQSGNKLNILGYQPRPSFVLFSLSQDTYQAAFDDFRRQREEDLKEIVFAEFPSPIAHYFYRFENGYENELQRLHFMRDSWEATVDVLHAIATAECRFRKRSLADPIKFSHLLTDSMAQRLLNIERIISQSKAQGVDLQIAEIVSIATLQAMRELNQSRNGFSHSAAQSEAQARTWIIECYEDVIGILDDLRALSRVRVLRYLGQTDNRTLRCEVFRGHGFTKTINSLVVNDNQLGESQRYFRQGEVLISYDECIFSLRPIVYFREDTTGHTTKLCMFRKTRGAGTNRCIEYEVVGESTRWTEDRNLFKPEIDELRGLFGLQPD